MVERKRERLLTVRMNAAEMAMVEALASREGLSASEWIRNIVRREHTLATAAKPPKPKRK
jgi:hypothetical protein